jgi:hypothetical protein
MADGLIRAALAADYVNGANSGVGARFQGRSSGVRRCGGRSRPNLRTVVSKAVECIFID